MTGYEIHDLIGQNRELISETWYYFLTVHLAIFGIVYLSGRSARIFERLTLMIAYCGFTYVNFRAQGDNYARQQEFYDQVIALPDVAENQIAKALIPMDQSMWIMEYLEYVYIGAAIFSILIIVATKHRRED